MVACEYTLETLEDVIEGAVHLCVEESEVEDSTWLYCSRWWWGESEV